MLVTSRAFATPGLTDSFSPPLLVRRTELKSENAAPSRSPRFDGSSRRSYCRKYHALPKWSCRDRTGRHHQAGCRRHHQRGQLVFTRGGAASTAPSIGPPVRSFSRSAGRSVAPQPARPRSPAGIVYRLGMSSMRSARCGATERGASPSFSQVATKRAWSSLMDTTSGALPSLPFRPVRTVSRSTRQRRSPKSPSVIGSKRTAFRSASCSAAFRKPTSRRTGKSRIACYAADRSRKGLVVSYCQKERS